MSWECKCSYQYIINIYNYFALILNLSIIIEERKGVRNLFFERLSLAGDLSRPLKEICLFALSAGDVISHHFKRKLLCDWKLFKKQHVYFMFSGFKIMS
jgi:hypothetical protein